MTAENHTNPNKNAWPLPGKIPQAGSIVAVRDGIYNQLNKDGGLEIFALCRAGLVQATLSLKANGIVLGRYDDTATAQEYQLDSGKTYLEDFGGRVEGPAYPTSLSFEEWTEKQFLAVRTASRQEGYRPVRRIFLNPKPGPLLGADPIEMASGTASGSALYPMVISYRLTKVQAHQDLIRSAAELYLPNPQIEEIEQSSEVTGSQKNVPYLRFLGRARNQEHDLFISIFLSEMKPATIVGFCAWADRSKAQEEVLAMQKLFLQSLVLRS